MSKERRLSETLSGRGGLARVLTASLCVLGIVMTIAVAACNSSSSSSFKPHHFSFDVSGGLWVANGTNVLEFISPFTSHTPNITPTVSVTVTSTGFISAQGVVFDSEGDLWVIDGGNLATTSTGATAPALDEFTAAQLAPGGSLTLTPAVVITDTAGSPPLGFPQQAVFDSTGNLWVTDNSAGDVNVFSSSQLAVSGDVVPHATLTATGADLFSGPLGIVFDSSGDLWVANNGDTNIFEFDNTTVETVLTTGGANLAVPDVVLSNANSSIQGPWALIFDTGGDLRSSNANAPNTVVEFSAADLAASGSPAPAVTLTPINVKKVPSLNSPNGIALDLFGNLAVANSISPFSIAIYDPGELTTGGAIKPEVLISGSNTGLTAPAGDTFGPLIP